MPDNESLHRQKFTQIQEIPAPDQLISGWYTASTIQLTAEGEVKRGTLLMSSGNNEFTLATRDGVRSAYELAVLCSDIDTEGEPAVAAAYFTGAVNGEELILPYETEEDVHSELVENILPLLRRQGMTLVGSGQWSGASH